MLFNSYPFLFLFLPLTLLIYFIVRKPFLAKFTLLIASLFFYAYWDMRYLPLLMFSIACNYCFGAKILRTANNKGWFWTGVSFNLLSLFYFKYSVFFLSLFNIVMDPTPLPLGISFFTFTQIAFLVDAYKRQVSSISPLSYGLFVTVFPHLIAGPILHHGKMRPQFEDGKRYFWDSSNFTKGLIIFAIGLCKKILIADFISPIVLQLFDQHIGPYGFMEAWIAALAYTFQLYFDFSGYSDMAIGLGWMLNFELPINFNSPYKATSIIDFWRRWHISLSSFLRDYLYIPLGGNRKGKFRRHLNLLATMTLGGLWHGAGWTFIIWGTLHGGYLVINHLFKEKIKLPFPASWILTFLAIMVGWVFFRAPNVTQALLILNGLVDFHATSDMLLISTKRVAWIGLAALIALIMPNSNQIGLRFALNRRWGFITGSAMAACVVFFDQLSEFLYFQF